ncbi:NO-inducible flavohemoprotein [Rhizobium leguminosarum]|uniref:nitric oxide dioxygenase n=1 Tax=Rhizobium leguminosarum TaxID=384 RepID=A0A444I7H9_RHILE|nr:NO-inducible flavohemoprotein [Rhizobium leguminosarum]RWX34178.1 NO-inducible flavohemoprotein [Rhizobium leguminosarum]
MSKMLSPETITIVKATIPALDEHGAVITAAMYRQLFEDAEIAALFNQSNQKSGTQIHALAAAILAYARNIESLAALGPAVERIAQKHIGYAILPEHYPHVATALLGAIEEVLGQAAAPDVLAAWAEAYWFLADILKGREAEIRGDLVSQAGGWTGWRRFVVSERTQESDTITSFILLPQDGGRVLRHKPGQYLTFRFDAAGREGLKRNYSISCAPNDEHYRISVKREPQGDASVYLHDEASTGLVVECTPPAGDFFLSDAPQRPVVLLSGGVGLTPMVSMLEALAEKHAGHPTFYIHGTASRATHAFDVHVKILAARQQATSVATFYDQSSDEAEVHSGYISFEWLLANTPFMEADFYICGPRPFMRFFVSGLTQAGVSADRIHYEFFGPTDELLAA